MYVDQPPMVFTNYPKAVQPTVGRDMFSFFFSCVSLTHTNKNLYMSDIIVVSIDLDENADKKSG